jgi:hypothetical protein
MRAEIAISALNKKEEGSDVLGDEVQHFVLYHT